MTEKEKAIGCGKPTGSLVGEQKSTESNPKETQKKETAIMTAKVGQKAPDFEAPAYHNGSFGSVKLSDHFGKWILLCFYPGDFTFV